MALLKIARMGHPVLRQAADIVRDPEAPEVQRLIANMIETMQDAEGVGLAAPQVYEPRRIVIFRIPGWRQTAEERRGETAGEGEGGGVPLTVLINPQFEPLDPRQEDDWEGCLSIPGLTGRVPRYRHIRYWGLRPDGRMMCREAKGFHARVVQHELDHLDGVLYPERMTDLATFAFSSELKRGWDRAGGESQAA